MNPRHWIARNHKQAQWAGYAVFTLFFVIDQLLFRRIDDNAHRLLQFVPAIFLLAWSVTMSVARRKYGVPFVPKYGVQSSRFAAYTYSAAVLILLIYLIALRFYLV
jgi:hypothetical protein